LSITFAAHGVDQVADMCAADRNRKALEAALKREPRSYEAHQAEVNISADVEIVAPR
jgi:hypothetical protein